MSRRPPDFVALVETNSSDWAMEAWWEDYTRVTWATAPGKRDTGVELYKHSACPYLVETVRQGNGGKLLLVKVFTPDTYYYHLVVHAPQEKFVLLYTLFWLRLWAKITALIDIKRLLILGDVNSLFQEQDRVGKPTKKRGWESFCRAAGLRELTQHTDVPHSTYSGYGGAGSRIDTAATTAESDVRILAAEYWPSTLFSDVRTPLLLHVDFKNETLDKPQPNCVKRAPEFHLKEVALTEDETASLRDAMHSRPEHDPVGAPRKWLRETQLALYEWATENNRVIKKTFNNLETEQRPPQGTADPDPDGDLPGLVGPLDMLPEPAALIAALSALSGVRDPTEAALKASYRRQADTLLAQWTATERQQLGRNRGEPRAAGRSRKAWKDIKKVVRSAARQPKIDMIPWQNKAILNQRETLRQVYDDQIALQGDKSVIADDPARLAALTRYLGMMPQHSAAPAR